MRAQLLLCDYAQISDGKLHIIGGGIDRISGPGLPPGFTVAIHMQIPWDKANQPIPFTLELLTEDGRAVVTDERGVEIRIQGAVEAGRPPGLKPGTPLGMPLVVQAGGIPLTPGRYEWRVSIDGGTNDEWQQTFTVVA